MTPESAPLLNAAQSAVYAAGIPLQHTAVPAEEIVSGEPTQATQELGTIGDVEVGVWELRNGSVTDTEIDEIFVVLSGNATIDFLDEGREVVVGAGDVMRLAAGTRTRWTVRDHLRKVYLALAE